MNLEFTLTLMMKQMPAGGPSKMRLVTQREVSV